MDITAEELRLFHNAPDALPLYEAVREWILAEYPDVTLRPRNTQIGFFAKYGFAWVSLPFRKHKELPDGCIIVSFGLACERKSPRIWQAANPYPNRWTHHVAFSHPAQLDDELKGWLREAHAFGLSR